MKTLIASTFCLALLAGAPVFAAGKKAHMSKMDTDKDGKVSMSEFMAAKHGKKAEAHFKQIDTNADGFLSTDEMAAAHRAKKAAK